MSSLFCLSSSTSNNVVFLATSNDSCLFIICIFDNNSIKNIICISLKSNLHLPILSSIFIFSKFLFFGSKFISNKKSTEIFSTKSNPLILTKLLKSPSKLSKVNIEKFSIFIIYLSNSSFLSILNV